MPWVQKRVRWTLVLLLGRGGESPPARFWAEGQRGPAPGAGACAAWQQDSCLLEPLHPCVLLWAGELTLGVKTPVPGGGAQELPGCPNGLWPLAAQVTAVLCLFAFPWGTLNFNS